MTKTIEKTAIITYSVTRKITVTLPKIKKMSKEEAFLVLSELKFLHNVQEVTTPGYTDIIIALTVRCGRKIKNMPNNLENKIIGSIDNIVI